MKLVSAAKLRRAQEALLKVGPITSASRDWPDSLLARQQMAPPDDAKHAWSDPVITSDRGLCGGYNANLVRRAEESRRDAQEGIEP